MWITLCLLLALAGVWAGRDILIALLFAHSHDLRYSGLLNYLFIHREIFTRNEYGGVLPRTANCRVFDIGGNLGLYTLYLNERYDNLEVHVFEPSRSLFASLTHNIRRNTKPSNLVVLNQLGLSSKAENMALNYFPNASGLSTFRPDLDSKRDLIINSRSKKSLLPGLHSVWLGLLCKRYFVPAQEAAQLIRLSDYIESRAITRIDIVKIDVEGYELEVLEGIESRHFSRIDAFMIEVENFRAGQLAAIVALLKKHDYHIATVGDDEPWSFVTATRQRVAG
jgi:FkbM family methyltransferase